MPVAARRSIVLGVLCLVVALAATVAAMYRHQPVIGLSTAHPVPAAAAAG